MLQQCSVSAHHTVSASAPPTQRHQKDSGLLQKASSDQGHEDQSAKDHHLGELRLATAKMNCPALARFRPRLHEGARATLLRSLSARSSQQQWKKLCEVRFQDSDVQRIVLGDEAGGTNEPESPKVISACSESPALAASTRGSSTVLNMAFTNDRKTIEQMKHEPQLPASRARHHCC